MGDGLITGFLFCIVVVLSLIEIIKRKDISAMKIFNGIIGLLMLILSVNNILSIENQKTNFVTDNPFIGVAFAGFTQGTGLYVLGIGGLGVFLFSLFGFLEKRTIQRSSDSKRWNVYLPILIVLLVSGILLSNKFISGSAPTEEKMTAIFKKDVETMGQCLITGDYDCFISYNHPMIVQGYGSKEKMKELIDQFMTGYKDQQGQYKKIEFVNVQQIEETGRNIQAVLNQKVTIDNKGEQNIETQKILAVSEDNGVSWHYINLTGMSKDQIYKFYPYFNDNLNF